MNGGTRLSDVVDGTSKTFAVGERSWDCNAAAWVGNRNPGGNGANGHYYTLGVVGDSQTDDNDRPLWPRPLNAPYSTPAERQNMCSKGFASKHVGGGHFLMCDGGVTFISENIEYRDGNITGRIWRDIGTYQKLGIMDDQLPLGDY